MTIFPIGDWEKHARVDGQVGEASLLALRPTRPKIGCCPVTLLHQV